MNPSPFEIAQQTSNNFAQVGQRRQDTNAIENILAQAMSANDPAVLQNSIGKILSQVSPERQGPAVQYLQSVMSNLKEQQLQTNQQSQSSGVQQNNPAQPNITRFSPKIPEEQSIQSIDPSSQSIDGGLRSMPEDQLIQMNNAKSKQELKRRQTEKVAAEKKNEKKPSLGNKIAEKRAEELLKRADEIAESLPQKQSSLNLMNDSVLSKDLSFWSLDNLAELTGIEGLRSQEGSIFKTAAKEYFLGSLTRAGARPNQWIEQQISDMLTKIGRSTQANLSVARALQSELDIEKERVRLTYEIADEIDNTDGDYRKLAPRLNESLSKYAETKQSELFNDIKAIKSIAEGSNEDLRKVEKGTKISLVVAQALLRKFKNDPKKAAEEAQKLGYSFE